MKKILIIYCSLISMMGFSQQIDTLYFDSDWKKVADKAFADNYVITLTSAEDNIMARGFNIADNSAVFRGTYSSIDVNYFPNSIKNGKYITYHKNGNKRNEWNFISNKKEGKQFDYNEQGEVSTEAICENDKPAFMKMYYNNGNVREEFSLTDDMFNGLWKRYYENGALAIEQEMKNNERNGIFKQYDENGNLTCQATFINGLMNGETIFYQNGQPILIEHHKKGLPVGITEDRRNGSISKTLYKESVNNSSSNLRLSCSAYQGGVAVKETGTLWNMLSEVPMPTGEKYQKFMCFNLHMLNDLNDNINVKIDNVKVEYSYKKKKSDNLAYSEEMAVHLFERSAQHTAHKAYSDASYIAKSAATQTTQSSSSTSSYNSTKVTGQSKTDSSGSSTSAAIAGAIAGIFGADNSGNSAAAVGSSVASAASKTTSSSQSKTTASANISQTKGEYSTNTTTHKDGYLEYQIYNSESEKAAQIASDANNLLAERVQLARYSHTLLAPNVLQTKMILAFIEKKYDTVKLYFTLNDIPHEIEFTITELLGTY